MRPKWGLCSGSSPTSLVLKQSERLQLRLLMHCLLKPLPNWFALLLVLGTLGRFELVWAQNSQQPATDQSDAGQQPSRVVSASPSGSPEQNAAPPHAPFALLISPGDELEITVYGAPDLSEHTRVSVGGNISMPLIGDVRVAGLSNSEAAEAIESQLRRNNIVVDPQVSVYLKEYTSGRISVAGEVVKPGVYSALGPRRLFDVLQGAGGLTEKAADTAIISHSGGENPVTIELPKDPADWAVNNVDILPGDTVVVQRAGIVYVLGEINKPGGYVLNSTGGVTLLRIVVAAGGPTRLASVGHTRIVRRTANGLQELPVPLKSILRAKVPDVPVQADDIIYIPSSGVKNAVNAGFLFTTLSTMAIYRVPF